MDHTSRLARVGLLAMLLVAATAGAAWAGTGTYVRQNGQIVFYYGVSSGQGESYSFDGYGTARLCADAPGAKQHVMFNARFQHERRFQLDETLKDLFLYYDDSAYTSGSFSTSSSARYHTDATWNYAAGASQAANGYSRAC